MRCVGCLRAEQVRFVCTYVELTAATPMPPLFRSFPSPLSPPQFFMLLVEHGAKWTAQAPDNKRMLALAVHYEQDGVARWLLEQVCMYACMCACMSVYASE